MLRALRFCLVLLLVSLCAPSQDVREFEKRITEFTLANGMHFIVMERRVAPVVSFRTYVNAGSADDPSERLYPALFTIVAVGNPDAYVTGLNALGPAPRPIDLAIPPPEEPKKK